MGAERPATLQRSAPASGSGEAAFPRSSLTPRPDGGAAGAGSVPVQVRAEVARSHRIRTGPIATGHEARPAEILATRPSPRGRSSPSDQNLALTLTCSPPSPATVKLTVPWISKMRAASALDVSWWWNRVSSRTSVISTISSKTRPSSKST